MPEPEGGCDPAVERGGGRGRDCDREYTEFVQANWRRLLRLARLLTGDEHRGEDLLQDCLVKLYVRWRKVGAAGDPFAYLRAMLTNGSVSRWRRMRREYPLDTIPVEQADRSLESAQAQANGGPAAAFLDEDLRQALRALPKGQRAVVVLRHCEDLTERETAALLGCSIGTVKSQNARAIAALRARLDTGSRAPIGAALGPSVGKGTGEQSLAAGIFTRLQPGMLLLCDRGFYSFSGWCAAADSGADLLWRIGDIVDLPLIEYCGDGSYVSVVFDPRAAPPAERARILAAARSGESLADEPYARLVRVVEYDVPDRGEKDARELICLITTILDPREAPVADLAAGYHERWEHETANAEEKTVLRGPGRILRSHSPDMVRQELYGYLLTHYALRALICKAATEADIDPDRVKFTRTVRIARRRIADPAAFPPEHTATRPTLATEITAPRNLQQRRHRSYPRVIKRGRHNAYRIKRPADRGTRHPAPPTINLVNLAAAPQPPMIKLH